MIQNDVKRARIKLALLEEKYIGALIADIIDKLPKEEPVSVQQVMKKLKEEYHQVIAKVPGDSKQLSSIKENEKI